MPRRRTSAFDDLMSFASRLPWKIGIGLGVIAYVALHIVALRSTQTVTATSPADLGSFVVRGYVHIVALLGQYVIPAGFLIGAAVSFLRRRHSIILLDEARAGTDVASISWQEFEQLVGEGFRQQGFKVGERGGPSPDGGVDLELTKAGKRYFVQCKQWRAQQVGVSVIRELCGVIATEQVHGGYVVTSGRFTREATEYALRSHIVLIDGAGLRQFMGQQTTPFIANIDSLLAAPARSAAPVCPGCGKRMVERTAKKGAMIGQAFWGCQDYPRCRRIVPRSV